MIKVYSTTWCPWCVKVKKYLESKGYEYEEINVADEKEARDEVLNISGQRSVPVVDINGTVIVGFDREAIDNALK
ncbi:glutaredoxin family protein [Clostridium polynesiense]|uniref:glutaredoxin family protein n=1 Tax=Clostridium polynesiense TaxID=1325933 RepID=UPI00058E6673|nr:glutaredoxin family protein [Clostridium polynesiense]